MQVENLVGQSFGQYQLSELLGAGGMGAVYRAFQASLTRDVAVKVLSPALADQPGFTERFDREARVAASLEHAHIVPVYDYGTRDKLSYVVMRLLTGGSLEGRLRQAIIERQALFPVDQIIHVLNALASALDYAHSRGVIHRDVKPGNIMFDNQGEIYLVDFGIAKLMLQTTGLTADEMSVMGTPSYMSPEQWRSEALTPAADQYALAVVVYVMLTGQLPFVADTPYQMMHKHLNEMPTPPDAIRFGLPVSVSNVLDQALEKEPQNRFPTITAFAQAFERAIDEPAQTLTHPTAAQIPPPPPLMVLDTATRPMQAPTRGRSNGSLLIVGGIAGAVMLAALVLFVVVQFLSRQPTAVGAAVTTISLTGAPTPIAQFGPVLTDANAVAATAVVRPTALPLVDNPSAGATVTAFPLFNGSTAPTAVLPPTTPGSEFDPAPASGSDLPVGFRRADLQGQVFREGAGGVPILYAMEPPGFSGGEPYVTVNVDNYVAYSRASKDSKPMGYMAKNHDYPLLRVAGDFGFVRGSKFSGWIVLDPTYLTIHGSIESAG